MNKSGTADQVIALPQGGGAIKGLGESFSPDLHTGTGNVTVPIALPTGRNKLEPGLSLVYSSGNGNGLFGLGWALSVPGVARDTTKGVPLYVDSTDPFLLSGAEQLVPTKPSSNGAMRYRPRTEGIFARIEHHVSARDDHWEVRNRNGLKSFYGSPGSRGKDLGVVRDPDNPLKVFSWSLTETSDPFGNLIQYAYEREPSPDDGPHHWDQIYLRTIRYVDYGAKSAPQFLVTVTFVYEARPDPFSTYRAGFEIRTTRRCKRIEVRTQADRAQLVRVYQLVYQDEPQPSTPLANGVSLLRRVQVQGVDGNAQEALPPLDFSYTVFDPAKKVYRAVSGTGNAIPERSLAHPDFELADLFGRGLPDVVQIGDENRYWRNLGEGMFDPPRSFVGLPAGVHLGDQGAQLADCDGDGHIDLAVSKSGLNGYFPLTVVPSDQVRPFISSTAAPPFPLNDPEMRLLDLNGDGITDALRTGTQFELFYFDRVMGWTQTELRARDDLDRFPNVYFSDSRVKLADMTGDGLQDIVFVSNGRIDYWPYFGNGKWGNRITMAGCVQFPDASRYGGLGFDAKRVLLGDVDGDGAADLVYVESGRITIWLNQNGNRWSDPIVVRGTPPIADIDAVRLADLLGEGVAGILWTYDDRTFSDSTYKFLDLTGGVKPYLLNERNNNTGARTLVEYASSTRFYLEDERQPSTRWTGRLPFPVQVVARVEVIDAFSNGKLTTEYRYHQGYWDGDEREFRGFGMVEQFDTEAFALYNTPGLHGRQPFNSIDAVHFSPPTLTRTWFHQGQMEDSQGTWAEGDISPTVWSGDPGLFGSSQRAELAAIKRVASQAADPLRVRHALRALRGSVLRTELYALDGQPNCNKPYTVNESLFDVREIEADDPGAANRLRIFFPFQIATRTTQWERGSDPMTRCSFTTGYDDYGLPQSQLAVAVPRGRNPLVNIDAAGEPYLSAYSLTEYARRDDDQKYIVDRISRTTSYEVLNNGRQNVFAVRDAVFGGSAQLRVIAHTHNYYDGNAFTGLAPGSIGDFGALVRAESLAFTDDFLKRTFDQTDSLSMSPSPCYLNTAAPLNWPAEYPSNFKAALPPLAGYVHYAQADVPGSPPGYFVVTERHSYDFHDPNLISRGLAIIGRDSLGAETKIAYDGFGLLPEQVTDVLGLVTQVQNDYRVLQLRTVTDPNGNSSEFQFSPAGFLKCQVVRGKNGEGDGANPSVQMVYDLSAFMERGHPVSVRTIHRVHHDSETDVATAERNATIQFVEYSDGFGRLLQKRAQAEDTLFGDPVFGNVVLSPDQSAAAVPAVGRTRQSTDPVNVVVSGWQVYDNKGRVVEKYEPFFAQGWDFSPPADAQLGQRVVIFYDPRGQVIRTVNPDNSEQLIVHGVPADVADPTNFTPTAWEAYMYDANDNAGRTHGNAASAYQNHWNTPGSIVLDALGRTVTAIARNGPDPRKDWYATRSTYDIQGNLLTVTDTLGRVAFRYVFDLAKRRWRVDSIDAGCRDTVPDALDSLVEARDSKGALLLKTYDDVHRSARIWARDSSSGAVTLRQVFAYGDGGSAAQSAADRAAARSSNLLRQLTAHHDEAGLATITAVDFKGNYLEKSRRVIADAPMLAVFSQGAANNWQVASFQVDWQGAAGQSLSDVEASLLEPTAHRMSATYDALNRIKQMQFPQDVEGKRATFLPTYNPAGGLEKVFLDQTLYVDRIAYDAKGQRSLIAYGNGVMTRYAYDPQTFRVRRLRSERFTRPQPLTYAASGNVLQDFAYDYDLAGNILSIQDRTPGSGVLNNPDAVSASDPTLTQLLTGGDALIRRFTYDPIYRLLSGTGRECDVPPDGPPWLDIPRCTDITKTRTYAESYSYDSTGSMRTLQHRNNTSGYVRIFTIESASNRLQSLQIGQTTFAYSFDTNGNTLSESSSRHFEWDHADQMRAFRTQTSGAEPSVYAHYLYDSSGQRVKKLVRKQGGQVEVTHYIDAVFEHHRWGAGVEGTENNILRVTDDKRDVALVRVGPAQPGDPAPPVQFQLSDHLGSSNVIVDSTGALVNREEFLPYGETSFGSFAKKRYRFTGVERDEETSFAYHGARYYSSWLCRWSNCDPSGPVADHNTYRYSHDNPIRLVDRRGTDDGDPTQPPSIQGVGLTINSNGIKFGPFSVVTAGSCDNLNPNCTGIVNESNDKESEKVDIEEWLKTYSPGPNKDVVWRKSSVDPDPLELGFAPENPDANYSPGQHVLNEQGGKGGSQYVSASRKKGGATNIEGDPYAISVPKAEAAGGKFHSTEDIKKDLERMTQEDPEKYPAERWESSWKKAQNPGGMEGGEVLFEPGSAGIIPPEAVETPWLRNMRGVSRAFFWIGVAFTAKDLGEALKETIDTGDIRPFAREVVRQAAGWGGALAGAGEGAAFGATVGSLFGPVGTVVGGVVGGIVGGIIGGIAGFLAGDWLSNLF